MSISITKEEMQTVGKYILEGMTEEQACVLADISYLQLQDAKEGNELIGKFIEKKKTEFKYNHIKEIQKNKSEKNSQWLLEKLYPEEFGPKARSGQTESPVNIISVIIKDIQNDNQGIIPSISRGTRPEIGSESESDKATGSERIAEILN